MNGSGATIKDDDEEEEEEDGDEVGMDIERDFNEERCGSTGNELALPTGEDCGVVMSFNNGALQSVLELEGEELIQSLTKQSQPITTNTLAAPHTYFILGVQDWSETLLNMKRAMLRNCLFHCDITLNQINNDIGLE